MCKNIIVLTGSPRKNGNSEKMADAFMQGAEKKGHCVVKFETAQSNIGGCRACYACWKSGKPCVFNDDFNKLASILETADVIVFATPLYWYGVPAQLKAAIDKMNAYLVQACKTPLKIKESAFLICGADETEKSFAGAVETYKLSAEFMKWEEKGLIVVPGVSKTGDIEKTDALLKAEALGFSI